MPIITISRQLGSMGTEIAHLLGEALECRYLDKGSLENAFGQLGMAKESVDRFDERKPGFWDLFKTDKARYLHFMKAAIFEFARGGSGVILGRGSQLLLANLPGILRVRIIAPEDVRAQRIIKRLECDENHARKLIQLSDSDRSGFHRFFFGKNWEDLSLYDLVINTSSLSSNTAVALVKNIVYSDEFEAAQKETQVKLEDLCLEHEIKTTIVYKEQIVVQFLEVFAQQGVVTLRGIADNSDDLERCKHIAKEIKGVKNVSNEIYYSPITTAYGIHY